MADQILDETSTSDEAAPRSAGLGSKKARAGYELRTPVNHVLSICDLLLEDESLTESTRADLSKIHQSARKLITLVGEFLDQAKAMGEAELKRLRHDLRTPVNHIIGYSEMLVEQAIEDGQNQRQTDLERIGEAGRNWLNLMEQRLGECHRGEDPEWTASPDASDREAPSPVSTLPDAADVAAGRVLIVDDDEWNRDVLARRVRQQGHEVEAAIDGASALDLLATQTFDLVLLDMIMPGLNGVDVLARKKAAEIG